MLITEQQLKEWEEIEKRATKGSWDTGYPEDGITFIGAGVSVFDNAYNFSARTNDAEFIVMARTAMPLLIKRVRELEEENMALHGLAIYPTK